MTVRHFRPLTIVGGLAGLATASLFVIAPTASARPAAPAGTPAGAQPAIVCGSNNGSSGTYVNSQKYPPATALTDTGAADFTVPAGGCLISGVDVTGQYSSTVFATKVNVLIKGGTTQPSGPDLAAASDKNITTFSTNSFGSFKVPLPSPVTLAPGHYWLIFQVKMPAGQTWSWETTPTVSGFTDVWRNPANGWACGTTWQQINGFCMAVPNADFTFQLI